MSRRRSFAAFEAVYCSGLFVPDPALVTALAILFDRVHFPSHINYVIEFPRRFRIEWPDNDIDLQRITSVSIHDDAGEEPPGLASLTLEQRRSMLRYLLMVSAFFEEYRPLFGPVFETSTAIGWREPDVRVIEEHAAGGYTFSADLGLQLHTTDDDPQAYLNALVDSGVVPVLGSSHVPVAEPELSTRTARYVASVVALNAARLVLPATKSAPADAILEARERLRDYLPPFWAAMMSMSMSVRKLLSHNPTHQDFDREVADLVDTQLFSVIVELRQKLSQDRKRLFSRILAGGQKALHLAVGRPNVSTADLLSTGLMLGAGVALDVAQEVTTASTSAHASPLTLLIEMDKSLQTPPRKRFRLTPAASVPALPPTDGGE